jgi:hypothetical protein
VCGTQPLPERMPRHQVAELAGPETVLTQLQSRLGLLLQGDQPLLLRSGDRPSWTSGSASGARTFKPGTVTGSPSAVHTASGLSTPKIMNATIARRTGRLGRIGLQKWVVTPNASRSWAMSCRSRTPGSYPR